MLNSTHLRLYIYITVPSTMKASILKTYFKLFQHQIFIYGNYFIFNIKRILFK